MTLEEVQERKKRIIAACLIAFIAASLFRSFVLEGFIVRGDSMDPTIASGEYVFVDKLAYIFASPKRGDVIVTTPREEKVKIIKRVIGLPGERFAIEGGKVIIRASRLDGGTTLSEDYVKGTTLSSTGITLINLDPGEYFALGDNREVSIDSRNLGPIDEWDIQGRAVGAFNLKTFTFKLF